MTLVCLWILDLVLGNKLVNGEGEAGEQVIRALVVSLASARKLTSFFTLIHFPSTRRPLLSLLWSEAEKSLVQGRIA